MAIVDSNEQQWLSSLVLDGYVLLAFVLNRLWKGEGACMSVKSSIRHMVTMACRQYRLIRWYPRPITGLTWVYKVRTCFSKKQIMI